jgi:Xaa-Pro aminopeptidase
MNAPTSPIAGRIADVRNALSRHGLAALVVPSSDPHISEYLAERWQGRRWLSGFTGSVGTLIVTPQFAGLWVDSRYWVQAEAQLQGTGVALMKIATAAATDHLNWLRENVPEGATVAIDGDVLALGASRDLTAALAARKATLRTDLDLLAETWKDRAAIPAAPIYEHLAPHATQSRGERLALLREEMAKRGVQWHLVSTVDDLAWIFNLRGADVQYNPVFLAHALVGMDAATLFVTPGKIDAGLEQRLAADGVKVAPYADVKGALAKLPADAAILVDPARVTLGLAKGIPQGVRVVEAINPSTLAKSRKSDAERQFVRQTMEQDGAALAEFFAWLEDAVARGEAITELTIDEKITAARARRPGFVGCSFSTIAGWNANGAMPHYRATEESHAKIEGEGLLLIDSGGQYLGGTTDITRVVAIRKVSAAQKSDYTLVLKGMIALSRAVFPRGLKSPRLDSIARAPIWSAGIDFGHGTGHGVGYFLNVHEGPQSISPAIPNEHHGMQPGMITSNEPGIYRPGRWGVRIENLVLAVPAVETEFGEFLNFETLTLCPIDTRCVDLALLGEADRQWLNDYHAMVRERLSKHVDGAAKDWLVRSTAPI